jgi:hypothetical protein
MADKLPFLLVWNHTWPNEPINKDFTGRLSSDPSLFARIYFSNSPPDPQGPWRWTVAAGAGQLESGYAANIQAAARAAEDAFANWAKRRSVRLTEVDPDVE